MTPKPKFWTKYKNLYFHIIPRKYDNEIVMSNISLYLLYTGVHIYVY